jgi:DNA processing protein
VRLAASAWVTPDRVRTAIARLLERPSVNAVEVIAALETMAGGGRELASVADTEAVAGRLSEAGAVVHIAGAGGYPRRLLDAWPELGAPLWLFAVAPGATLPRGPAVAVVGTRHPTLDGTRTARELAMLLARHGVTVVSGMARGIDQAAHLGALDAGGATVGVLGTGFGVDYPRRDGPIRDAVAAAGGLVSELVPGTPPQKPAFLWRNRIISGLADVTVVVEGRSGSGALHTARMAGAQGRDVLAVPGPVRAPTSRAPLDLIRDGAQPLTRLEDVLDVIGIGVAAGDDRPAAAPTIRLGEPAQQVLPLLGAVPASPAALAAATQQPVPAVMAAVAELTRAGLAAPTPRGVVRDQREAP